MIRAVLDRVVVKPTPKEVKSEGGIWLGGELKKDTATGLVLSVGPGMRDKKTGRLVPTEIKVGETVSFHHDVGMHVEDGGEKLLIMREQDLLGVVQH